MIIGIDLGTTNSLAAVFRNGRSELIPNAFGEYLTPSVVNVDEKGQNVTVGKIAKERLVTEPKLTAQLFKRRMGTQTKYPMGKKHFTPEELSAMVIKQLVSDAEVYLGEKVDEVVISVPAYFDALQRKATKMAGQMLGLKVDRLINEPSAAAIAYHRENTYETFVVFDFGGGTLDVSVVDCFENVISINSIAGNNHLGGSDFDRALADYFCRQNNLQFTAFSDGEQRSILLLAERVKIALGSKEEVIMSMNLKGEERACIVTPGILRHISQVILDEIRDVIGKAVKDSGFTADELSGLILVGGSSHMPLVRDYLTELLNIPVIRTADTDLLVAKGLGTYIGMKERREEVKDLVITDICPFSLGTGVINREEKKWKDWFKVIIPRNTVLPASEVTYLQTAVLGQKEVNIQVYQGEEMYAEDNLKLGSVTIPVPINKNEHEAFQVTYSYDINSMLYIEIEIVSTGKKHLFQVGSGEKLEAVHDIAHMSAVKDVSLQLNQNPELDACMERARRIYTELSEYEKESFMREAADYSKEFRLSLNNLKKKREVLEEFRAYLDKYEKYSGYDLLDIFAHPEKDEDENGGYLS